MDPVSAREPYVHARGAIVQATSTCGDQAGSKSPDLVFVVEADGCPFQAMATIQPHRVRPIHEDVRDRPILGDLLQGSQAVQLGVDGLRSFQGTSRSQQSAAGLDRGGDH